MKDLKVTAVLFFTLLGISSLSLSGQVCTPDLSMKSTGVFPTTLPAARVNEAYSQILQYYVTKDTMVNVPQLGMVNAKVDSLRIKQIIGVPNGMTYACNTMNCAIPGGGNGCIKVTGTPTQKGVFKLKIVIEIVASVLLFKQTIVDTIQNYTVTVSPGVGIEQINDQFNEGISIYPNPLGGGFLSFNYLGTSNYNGKIMVFNAQNNMVFDMPYFFQHGIKTNEIKLPELSAGIYFVAFSKPNGLVYKKVIIE
jgi:Secretion system C-terminal sorting domain